MSDSTAKVGLEEESKGALDESLESGKDATTTESVKVCEIIVAGGENKKSVEHILLPARLPKEKNVLERLWSKIFSGQPSNEASAIGKWSYLKPMKARREGFMTGIYNDKLFAFGGIGSGRCMEYLELNDPRARWEYQGEIFPEDLWASAAVVYGDSAYIFGGGISESPRTNVYRLSLVTPYTVEMIAQLPEPRSYHNAEIIDDKAIILCGIFKDNFNQPLDTVVEYDIRNNIFRALPPLPFKVQYAATAIWKNNVLIVGGQDEHSVLSTVWMYNASNGECEELPRMKYKRYCCAAVVAGGLLVVMGGESAIGVECLSAECYSFQTEKWTELPPIKQPRKYPSAVARCIPDEMCQVARDT